MIINDAGRKIIMDNEGLRLKAYLCPAGVPTIGYGHTGDVKLGDVITKHQAEVILEHDLQRFEESVGALVPKANANQFSALVSFAFNVGVANLKASRLLRLTESGQWLSAAAEFPKWIYARDPKTKKLVPLPGLVKRRDAERRLFLQAVS